MNENEEEMRDCHYRQTPTISNRVGCDDEESKKILDSKIFDLRDCSKRQRRQIDSVYVLPKVKFVEMNGTEIPVLDENMLKKVETIIKSESKISTEG